MRSEDGMCFNVALQLRSREQSGRRPRIRRIPPRLVLPFSTVARRARVALGFSLCGEFLYSIGGENEGAFFIERFDCRSKGRSARTAVMRNKSDAEISFPLFGDRAVCRASAIGDNEASLDSTVLVLHQSRDLAVGLCTAAALSSSTDSGTARWWWMGLFPATLDPEIECQNLRHRCSTSNDNTDNAAIGVQFNVLMTEEREPNLQHLYLLCTRHPAGAHKALPRQWILLVNCGNCLRLLLLSEEPRTEARAAAAAPAPEKAEVEAAEQSEQNPDTGTMDAWNTAFGCGLVASGASMAGVHFRPQKEWRGGLSTPLLSVSPLTWQGVDQQNQNSTISSRISVTTAQAEPVDAAVDGVEAETLARDTCNSVKRRHRLTPRLHVDAERVFDYDEFLRLVLRNMNNFRHNSCGAAAQHRPRDQQHRQLGRKQQEWQKHRLDNHVDNGKQGECRVQHYHKQLQRQRHQQQPLVKQQSSVCKPLQCQGWQTQARVQKSTRLRKRARSDVKSRPRTGKRRIRRAITAVDDPESFNFGVVQESRLTMPHHQAQHAVHLEDFEVQVAGFNIADNSVLLGCAAKLLRSTAIVAVGARLDVASGSVRVIHIGRCQHASLSATLRLICQKLRRANACSCLQRPYVLSNLPVLRGTSLSTLINPYYPVALQHSERAGSF